MSIPVQFYLQCLYIVGWFFSIQLYKDWHSIASIMIALLYIVNLKNIEYLFFLTYIGKNIWF